MATKTDRKAESSPHSPDGPHGSRAPHAPHTPAAPPDLTTRLVHAIEPYASQIAVALVAAFVIIVGAIAWSAWSAHSRSLAWNSYFSALYSQSSTGAPTGGDPAADKLMAVSDAHPGTAPAIWAKIVIADGKLTDGGNKFVSRVDADRKEGEEFLGEARRLYSEAYEASKILPQAQGDLLQQRALFGLALAEESLAGRADKDAETNYKSAEKHYKELETKWPQSLYTIRAKQRLTQLGDKRTVAFYEKFRAYEPEAPKGPGVPGVKPNFNDLDLSPPLSSGPAGISTPGETNKLGPFGTPDPTAPATPATETPKTETPAPTTPPAGEAPAAPATEEAPKTETPKADAPATETPAAPATPAPEAPKSEAPAAPSETPAAPAPANP